MNQFTLDLDDEEVKPIIILENWKNYRALLDTGSYFPIWTDDEDILKDFGGRCIQERVSFSGFGGDTQGNMFILPELKVGDLNYSNLPIVACSDLGNAPFQLILSATMFHRLIYTIDDLNHKFTVMVPDGESHERTLRMERINGRLQVLS